MKNEYVAINVKTIKRVIIIAVAVLLILGGCMINKDEVSLQSKMDNYVIKNHGYDHYAVFTMNAAWEGNDEADYFQFDVYSDGGNFVESVTLHK